MPQQSQVLEWDQVSVCSVSDDRALLSWASPTGKYFSSIRYMLDTIVGRVMKSVLGQESKTRFCLCGILLLL